MEETANSFFTYAIILSGKNCETKNYFIGYKNTLFK